MKTKLLLLVFFCLTLLRVEAQPGITKSQWQADLIYLKELIDQKYEHLYRQLPRPEFQHYADELYKAIPNLSETEIMVGFAKLTARFKIGHSGISLFQSMHGESLKTGFHTLPVYFYLFSDGLYVQGTTEKHQRALGARVIKIGNKSAEEALQAIRPVVSVENESFFKGYGVIYLSCPEILQVVGVVPDLGPVTLVLEKDGERFEYALPANESHQIPAMSGFVPNLHGWVSSRNTDKTPLWRKNVKSSYFYEYLPDSKTVYVRHNQIQNGPEESIAQFYQRVFEFVEHEDVDRFILDLRQNGGGNNYLNKPIILGLIKSKVNEKGKLFTLIGRRTFSAAQNLVNELEQYTETTFIGEPTAENVNFWGDIQLETLPNSRLDVRLSYMWWQDKDPRDMRRATAPEMEVQLTSADFVNNQDPALELALSYKNVLPEILEELQTKIRQNDFKSAESRARRFLNDKEVSYGKKQLESKLNAWGYEHMTRNIETAKAIFSLNTRLFPQSANAWDSLAESYLNNKEMKKAATYYQKAISLDPDGLTGKHAQEMLIKIKHQGN